MQHLRCSIPLVLFSAAVFFLSAAGCTHSGGGDMPATGLELPNEISAIAAKEDGSPAQPAASLRASARRALAALNRLREAQAGAADLPPESDYHTAVVRKFVEIEVLDIFDIISQIFQAIGQTNYALVENVGTGPYKCMVSWEDEGDGGTTQKLLQTWTLSSAVLPVNGVTTNRVTVWIQETDGDGEEKVIRARLDIQAAPTRNDDGTLADLGAWEIRALFGDGTSDYFFADASVELDGTSRLRINERSAEDISGTPFTAETRAIIFRNEDLGYGKVEHPDWGPCHADPSSCPSGPPNVGVAFSYNDNYLTVQVDSQAPISFDRNDEHTIVHRYGLFLASDGRDVLRDRNFGFPVRLNDGRFGWYGAWQDRHQLWVGGSSLADGTVVTRQDLPPDQTPVSYTTKSFNGSLTKINLVTSRIDQVAGIPAEIFLFNNTMIEWDATHSIWEECAGNDGMGGCISTPDFTDRLASLEYAGAGDQRNISINRCGMSGCTNYVYLTSPSAGFFEATFDGMMGRWVSTGTPYTPADGDQLWCSVGGRTYIMYTAEFGGPTTTTGWVEKTVESFDQQTWTPTFEDGGDREFNFELNREYFINNRGANLRVTRVATDGDAEDYELYLEAQSVAKPASSLETLYPDGRVLVEPWDPDAHSTYVLDKDSASPTYLMLVYDSVSTQDATNGINAGDVVTMDLWGLRVQGDTAELPDAILYNWQYQGEGEFGQNVTYLRDGSSNYVLLDEPIRFQAVQLPRTTDLVNDIDSSEWLTFSMMFDGQMHGLPDTWWELEKVSFQGDEIPQILANNVVIPDGTELVDSNSVHYFVKTIDAGIFLGYVTAFPLGPAPNLSLSNSVNLTNDIPTFSAPSISTTIPDAELKYIEGIPVE